MSRKHFQLVADVVGASGVTANLTELQREDLAYQFARRLQNENERFDAERFFLACGVEDAHVTKMVDALDRGRVGLS